MSSTLSVRRIAVGQGAVYRELRNASLHEPYAPGEASDTDLPLDGQAAEAIAVQRAGSDASATFLLYTEGHPAGMIGAYFEAGFGRRAFVSELWVAHAVRHLRGGALLLETACHWLQERGAAEIFAWIAVQNHDAIRFYEHAGFIDTGERGPATRLPGTLKGLYLSRDFA
jgi:ribosomal protein S18 acetylase RimI-like enzyme